MNLDFEPDHQIEWRRARWGFWLLACVIAMLSGLALGKHLARSEASLPADPWAHFAEAPPMEVFPPGEMCAITNGSMGTAVDCNLAEARKEAHEALTRIQALEAAGARCKP